MPKQAEHRQNVQVSDAQDITQQQGQIETQGQQISDQQGQQGQQGQIETQDQQGQQGQISDQQDQQYKQHPWLTLLQVNNVLCFKREACLRRQQYKCRMCRVKIPNLGGGSRNSNMRHFVPDVGYLCRICYLKICGIGVDEYRMTKDKRLAFYVTEEGLPQFPWNTYIRFPATSKLSTREEYEYQVSEIARRLKKFVKHMKRETNDLWVQFRDSGCDPPVGEAEIYERVLTATMAGIGKSRGVSAKSHIRNEYAHIRQDIYRGRFWVGMTEFNESTMAEVECQQSRTDQLEEDRKIKEDMSAALAEYESMVDPVTWEMFKLREIEGLTWPQIGQMFDVTYPTVHERVKTMKKLIKSNYRSPFAPVPKEPVGLKRVKVTYRKRRK